VKETLRAEAEALGFCGFGVCRPDAVPQTAERLGAFLDAGYHGTMAWMEERQEWRGSAAALWPEARSVIMLAEPYTPDGDPLELLEARDRGAISVYARNRDYHDLVKKKLKRLGRWLIDEAGGEIKVFVDTAPVMEKPLGAASGLGWQGKHTNLVSQEIGNWFFLGAIFTSLEMEADEAGEDHCGSCRACLDICPTNAFPAPYQLDARRCISYLTIEHKGPVDPELRPLMGNRIYRLADLVELDDAGFRTLFAGSPIKRIGRDRFVRNVLYAIGNSGDRGLLGSVERLLEDPDPVVADAAVWAKMHLEMHPTEGG